MADQPCPCKQKLTDGEKGILNFGLSNEMLTNPNAAAIGIARQLGGANAFKIEQLISAAQEGGPTGLLNDALPSLLQGQNKLNELQGIVDGFEAECNRLTDPRQLVNIISSLSLYGELACALGIEGLDIGGGLQVVNENGQLSIQFAVAANVDLERVLNQIDPGLGTATAGAVESLRAGLDSALKTLDEANAAIQSVVDLTTSIQNEAANFIQQYTSINSLANLINEANTDPCFKLGGTLNGSLVSPDFLNAVRGGSPTGFGTSAR